MVFTTLPFIIFFAAVFFGYYALPSRYRWWLLLGASWFFYAYMTPYYLIFLGIATGVTYFAAIGIDNNLKRQREWISANGKLVDRESKKVYKVGMERKRNHLVALTVVALIGMLVAFKYLDFLFANVSWLGGVLGFDFSLSPLHLILPIGLSFYVFQSLGYCIDVSREMVPAERNFFRHALFVSYFPQVLQGPIGDYGRLAPQLFAGRDFSYQDAVFGLQRVVWGFFKKLVIANSIAIVLDPVWTHVESYEGCFIWLLFLFAYAVQLYADFSGYMDIACGCSQMLRINLDENFKSPYLSESIAGFWRNWHITLGVWFKNYLFYPLLRSDGMAQLRKRVPGKYLSGVLPTAIALLLVWCLIGLWHGADWCYVLYGLYHGSFIIASVVLADLYTWVDDFCSRLLPRCLVSTFKFFRTFVIVMIGYVLFAPGHLVGTQKILHSMMTGMNVGVVLSFLSLNWTRVVLWPALVCILFLVDVYHYRHPNGSVRVYVQRQCFVLRWSIYVISLLGLLFFGLYGMPALNQFAYFKF